MGFGVPILGKTPAGNNQNWRWTNRHSDSIDVTDRARWFVAGHGHLPVENPESCPLCRHPPGMTNRQSYHIYIIHIRVSFCPFSKLRLQYVTVYSYCFINRGVLVNNAKLFHCCHKGKKMHIACMGAMDQIAKPWGLNAASAKWGAPSHIVNAIRWFQRIIDR